MKRKLPTILILLAMVLVGAMYWVDMAYYTTPATGFVNRGGIGIRYAVLLIPLSMGILGLRTVSPRAIAVLRLRNTGLAFLFTIASITGAVYGIWQVVASLSPLSIYNIILGLLYTWYGVWMFCAALQLFVQFSPTPTNNVLLGIFAALPFCATTIYRVLVKPSTLYRLAPIIKNFSSLFAMLWFGMLLRAFYIALTRRRVRWMYLFGLFTFLLCACLELPQAVYAMMFGTITKLEFMEAVNYGVFGLVAGCISVSIARQDVPIEKEARVLRPRHVAKFKNNKAR